jgi:polyhydroxyalkanoate synthesis regulator phasin
MSNENWLQQILAIGIGTSTFVADKIREVSDEWVRTGRLDPDRARQLVDELMQRINAPNADGSPTENFETQVQNQLRRVLQDLGVPDRRELDELRGRLDRLERQVRDLENRQWR